MKISLLLLASFVEINLYSYSYQVRMNFKSYLNRILGIFYIRQLSTFA